MWLFERWGTTYNMNFLSPQETAYCKRANKGSFIPCCIFYTKLRSNLPLYDDTTSFRRRQLFGVARHVINNPTPRTPYLMTYA